LPTPNTYTAFGLVIQSELACPFLLPAEADSPPDISIRMASVPAELENPTAQGVAYQAQPGEFLMRLDDVAAYLISDGRDITIERAPCATDDEVLLFLFGSAIGALLHQRGMLTLHASAIETERGAVLFVGHSGNGKSTTAAALHKRGYRILADDICPLALDENGQPQALPGFPQLKLWADTAKKLEHDTEGLRRVRPQLEKFGLLVHDDFVNRPLPLYAVYQLTSHNKPEIEFEPIELSKRFNLLLFNTYRQRFLDGLQVRAEHFKVATAAGKAARMKRVIRPSAPFMLDELVDRLEQDFKAD
jgi:hypothetical protein